MLKPGPLQEQPLFQRRAVINIDAMHKLALVEVNGLGQPFATGATTAAMIRRWIGCGARMVVTGGHQVGKRGGIEPVVATWVELHSALGNQQKGWGGFVIGQHVAQAKERLPQIQKRFLFRLFRP